MDIFLVWIVKICVLTASFMTVLTITSLTCSTGIHQDNLTHHVYLTISKKNFEVISTGPLYFFLLHVKATHCCKCHTEVENNTVTPKFTVKNFSIPIDLGLKLCNKLPLSICFAKY